MFCLLYLGLFFISGDLAVLLLLFVYTLFNIFRMIGIALNDSTLKNISSVSNRGKVVANVNAAYQSSSVVVRVLTALFLGIQRFSGLVGLVALQMSRSGQLMGKQECPSSQPKHIVFRKEERQGPLLKEAMKVTFRRPPHPSIDQHSPSGHFGLTTLSSY
jgi:hypothetical protein